MEMNQVKRTVKKKFLIADKIGKGAKAVGKPLAIVFGMIIVATLKEAFTSKK